MSTITEKQPTIHRLFSKLIENNKMGHAYLFEGVSGSGKKEMALWVAKSLFCPNYEEQQAPCGECYQCTRIDSHQHPDVVEITPDGLSIKVAQVRQLKEEFTKSGVESKRKLFIVKDIEKMTPNAANSLLKFLEEPDGDITALLLTTAKQRLLPTILSRCQVVHFPVRPIEDRVQELVERGLYTSQASLLARLTHDADVAMEMAEEESIQELIEAVWKWFKWLSKKDEQAFVFVQTDLMKVAKDRGTQHRVLDLLIILYRDVLTLYYKETEQLAFVKQKDTLKQVAQHTSSKQLAYALDVFLSSKKKLDSNVAAQGIFEDISLQITAR